MKKIRLLTLCLLMVALITSVIPTTVFASPCCMLEIESVTQADGKITVDYWALNPLDNREVKVVIKTAENDNRLEVYTDYFYLSADSVDSEDTPYTFDGTFLLEGYKYEITLSYTYCCDNYYCSSVSDTMEFIVEEGVPVFDYVELPNGTLDLVGESKAAIKLISSAAGIYDFSVEDEWSYELKSYPSESRFRTGASYYSENETRICLIAKEDGSDLSANIEFAKCTIYETEVEKENPENNDVCFNISENRGLNAINIAKTGVYCFELEDKYEYNEFELISAKGSGISSGNINRDIKEVLEPGLYYVDTSYLTEEYAITVKYIVPEELNTNKTYSPTYDNVTFEKFFYIIKIAEPTVLTVNNPAEITCGIYKDGHMNYLYGEETLILPIGEYYAVLHNSREEGAEVTFSSKTFESVTLDTPFTPNVSMNDYYYYFAFKAPKDGKYEFDFTKYSRYYWFNDDNQDSSGLKYYTKELKKDEWILIGMYEQAEVTVREYVAPTVTELTFNETSYYDFVSGKEYIYSFTPSQDDLYKIYTENTYCKNIKIWTDDEVLFETDENYYYSINQNFELKKDVTVYISFSGEGDTYGNQSSVVVKSPYEEIVSGDSITVDNSAEVMVYYTATETGYHNINFSRSYGSSYSVAVTMKGNTYYIRNYGSTDALIYLEKDEKLFITFGIFGDNWLPEVNITISPVSIDELELDTSYAPSDKTYYSFIPEKDGVYKVTQPEGYRIDIRSDKSNYLALGENNDLYFVGKAGEKYLIYSYVPAYSTGGGSAPTYTDIKISEVAATDINVGSVYKTGSEFETFTFYVPKTGLYRIENELCNTRLDLFFDGQWSMISGVYSSLFRLEEGFNCIVAQQQTMSYESSGSTYEGIDTPYAKFKIREATDTQKVGINIEDAFISPNGGTPYLRFCVTSPYDVRDLSIGIEYTDENGQVAQNTVGYEAMYGSDMRYTECELYMADWTIGDTVTIKPYVYIGDNEYEKIYGEEETVTFNMRSDIIPLEYKTTKIPVKVQDNYNYYYKQYWFEFTQPADAEAQTYIYLSDSLENPSLRDENFEYVGSYQDVDGNAYYELEPGKKYYIRLTSYCDDSDAEITISSLPDVSAEASDIISNAEVTGEVVSFVVNENTTTEDKLYAAKYDENGVLLEIVTLDNPQGAYTINFNNSDKASKYKLMLIDEMLAPICNAVEL